VSGFLLDTNVVSEIRKPQPEPKVLQWVDASEQKLFYVSVLTLGELRKGIDSLPRSSRRTALESWLTYDLTLWFAGRILSVDRDIADRWGRIAAQAKLAGRAIPLTDGLLAATAMQHNLTLVTRNTRDVQLTGVPVFNPWES
jgi:toxin FitB